MHTDTNGPDTAAGGFFRVEQRAGMWTVVDPAGRAFHLRGCNHFADGSHMPWNRHQLYADAAAWRAALRDRFADWGFTYLPPSIGPSAIDPDTVDGPGDRRNLVTRTPEWPAEHFAGLDLPFAPFLEVPRQYMAGPDMGDVFADEFASAVDARCRAMCLPLAENPRLIGYHFCHNPPWNPTAGSAEQWIAQCTRPGSAGLREWAGLMRRIYGSIERWRETYGLPIRAWEDIERLDRPLRGNISGARLAADKEAFLERICRRWHEIYTESIRRYDPNHLILGDRNTLHLQPAPRPWAYHIIRQYVDVLSVNVMGPPRTIYDVLSQATRHWDGPVLLADTGGGVYDREPPKSAYQARDLAEYEEVYGGLVRMSVEHPQIVGFAWCGWYETPRPGGRSGLVDCRTDAPLPDRLAIVRKWNARAAETYPRSRGEPAG